MAQFSCVINVVLMVLTTMLLEGYYCSPQFKVVHMEASEFGNVGQSEVAKNCGSVPFNISWTPDTISPESGIVVSIDYKLPHALDGGTYDVLLYFHNDDTPFLELSDSFSCDQIKQYIPCPIPGGLHFKVTRKLPHIPNIASFTGDYDFKATVKNKEGFEMICLKAHIIIEKN